MEDVDVYLPPSFFVMSYIEKDYVVQKNFLLILNVSIVRSSCLILQFICYNSKVLLKQLYYEDAESF